MTPLDLPLKLRNRKFLLLALPLCFWYLSLFPGRLGYDYALLARIIRSGGQTSWWGATYFWIYKIFTFNASVLWLISALGLLVLAYSIVFFIDSIGLNERATFRVKLVIFWSPLFGVFGVTVSHDLFQTSGTILLTGIIWRGLKKSSVDHAIQKELFLAGVFLTVTQLGLAIFISGILGLFFIGHRHRNYVAIALVVPTISFLANLPITKESTIAPHSGDLPRNLLLVDLKCIAQHPEAEITPQEWSFLERFAPKDKWVSPTTCSNPDDLAAPLQLGNVNVKFDMQLLKTSLAIFSRQPAIPVISHIQRSRVALPPPFFQPPSNQISWDVNKPLGQGTNVALQEGPELLHPSIDDSIFNKRIPLLKPLEAMAQLPTLIVNQASWFWSWGGLWLYPLLYLFIRTRSANVSRLKSLVPVLPTMALHVLLVVIGPSSLGRYVMSTILMGFIGLLAFFFKRLEVGPAHD